MPSKQQVRRSTKRVREAFLSAQWCISQEKYDQMVAFLDMRANGDQLTKEEISMAISGNRLQGSDKVQVTDDGIMIIDAYGVLAPRLDLMTQISGGTSLSSIRQEALSAMTNDAVKTVILRIDSPGGTVVGTPEAADAIKKLAKVKRVVVSAEHQFASGAYWLGVAAGQGAVYASSSTMTGSIGVFAVHENTKRASEKAGVDHKVIRAGRLKASLHPEEDWTEDQIAERQRQVDVSYDSFIAHVAESRGVSETVVRSQFGEGSTFTAEEAKSRGMIDGVMTFDEVLARERERLASSSSSSANVSFAIDKESEMKISAKVKAAMFARELITDLDASDEVCVAVLGAYAMGRNENIEGMDEKALLELVMSSGKSQAGDIVNPAAPPVAPKVGEVGDAIGEVNRTHVASTVRAMGQGMSHVTDAMISEAICDVVDGETSLEQIIERWTDNAAALEPDVSVVPVASQVDKFNSGVLAWAVGKSNGIGDHLVTDEDRANGHSLRYSNFLGVAKAALHQAGVTRLDDNPVILANQFLQLGGTSKQYLPDLAAGGSVNYSGDHPAIVDIIANKMLWQPYPIADYKFDQWCGKISDVSNFDPHHFVEMAIFDEMDEFTEDDTKTRELKFNSEFKVWYEAGRYRNKVGLSVEMIVGDKVGGFMRQLNSLSDAPRRTLNRSCLQLLNQNPTMADNEKLFSAAHGNIIASGSGGAPDSTQASKMRLLHRKMKGYALDEMDIPPSRSLHPAEHEEAAKQTFMRSTYDNKVAQTDANINTVRNEISPVIDARLDGYSTKKWYTYVNPTLSPVIAYFYMNGYQNSGVRETWYDPESTKRYYALEARQGSAVVDHRGMVMNAGE